MQKPSSGYTTRTTVLRTDSEENTAVQVDRFPSIAAAFFDAVERLSNRPVYTQLVLESADPLGLSPSSTIPAGNSGSGPRCVMRRRTFLEVGERVGRIASALRRFGVKRGDAIAVLSNTRPEWMEADLGILAVGGITVSVYQSLPTQDVGYILYDSGARVVFAENAEQVQKLLALHEQAFPVPPTEDREAQIAELSISRIVAFESVEPHPLVTPLSEILAEEFDLETFEITPVDAGDLAALVYTSGTTGPPKGVMQTHRNHLANVRQAFQCELIAEGSSLMLFLPLAHSFAKLMGYIGFLTDVELRFPAISDPRSSRVDPASILRDIRLLSAALVPVVPRFLEKMRDGIEMKSRGQTLQSTILRLTLWASITCYRAELAHRRPTPLPRFVRMLTGPIRRKVREQLFGSGFVRAVSGGARLPLDVAYFFDALGIEVSQGYGLTETCVATNVIRAGMNRIGSVGPVLSPDIELRIAEDGEILFRGPNVTQGYYNRPSATRAAWDDQGWFHTGDLGTLDDDGYLTISGRKKELIVTSGGKKIAPNTIEDRLKSIRGVSQAVLIGDGRPYCIAVVTLDVPALVSAGVLRAETFSDPSRAPGASSVPPHLDAKVRNTVWSGVEGINRELSSFETVKNILIAPEDFTIENGLLTPSMKIKRNLVEQRYQREIAALYVKTHKPATDVTNQGNGAAETQIH